MKTTPSGCEPVYIYWIDTARKLARVFPELSRSGYSSGGSDLTEFFESLRVIPEVVAEFDFEDSSDAWYLRVLPEKSWKKSLKAIEDQRRKPTLQEHYGLKTHSAKLLEWIEGLTKEELLEEWTPVVEDALKKEIGIACPWDNRNFPAYIQLLIDEINDKTPYDLKIQPWKDYTDWKTRIRVREKESEESKIIRQIQFYGLQQGKFLEKQRVKELLTQLLDPRINADKR